VLEGQRLSSVCFVEDYIQLGFERAGVTLINSSTLLLGNALLKDGDAQTPALLRSLIGETIEAVEVQPSVHFAMHFGNGTTIRVSLDPADYRSGPEALTIQYDDDSVDVW
jgi:hypothetical protein